MAAITGPQLSMTHIDNRVTTFMRIVLFFPSRRRRQLVSALQ
jgi:hypothetical protein